jgi:hypothetical protein
VIGCGTSLAGRREKNINLLSNTVLTDEIIESLGAKSMFY